MKVIWKKTAEQLQSEVLGMHFTRNGIEKIMRVLAKNLDVIHETGEPIMVSGFEGDGYIYYGDNQIIVANKSQVEETP